MESTINASATLGIAVPAGLKPEEFNEWLMDSLIGYFGKRVETYVTENNLEELAKKLEGTAEFEEYWQILEENIENFEDFKQKILSDFKAEVEKKIKEVNDTGN